MFYIHFSEYWLRQRMFRIKFVCNKSSVCVMNIFCTWHNTDRMLLLLQASTSVWDNTLCTLYNVYLPIHGCYCLGTCFLKHWSMQCPSLPEILSHTASTGYTVKAHLSFSFFFTPQVKVGNSKSTFVFVAVFHLYEGCANVGGNYVSVFFSFPNSCKMTGSV